MFDNKTKFSLGEITPSLSYRVDLEIPTRGLRYLKNGICTTSAGLTNFPAFDFVKNISVSGVKAFKLFKYKINKKDTSLDGYLFLYTDQKVVVLRVDNFEVVKEIATKYTAEEIKNLSIAQFENSVISCVANKEPVMIRVTESTPEFTVVDYWANIQNPPVKRVESEYVYTEDDTLVFSWYKQGVKVIFESTIGNPIYKETFLNSVVKGSISIYGGEFRIEKIENPKGKHKITTTQITAPSGTIEVPNSDAPAEEKKINILDIVFSENLFSKGYPAVVTEYNGRVIFGNVAGNPSAVVSSRVFDSLNFRQSLEDNDGFVTFIAGNELNTIKDFISYKSLIAITDKGIFSTELNAELSPKSSAFYDQKLARPKGLGYWVESDDAIYYADTSDRIWQIQDVGADSAYKGMEVSAYSSHFLQDINDIFFFKYGKYNILGVDQEGAEGRALTYNLGESILCWTRTDKIAGINEYVNIDDKIYIFNANPENISIYTYSDTKVEPLSFELTGTTISQKARVDVPDYFKRIQYGRLRMMCFGDFDGTVNGARIRPEFNNTGEKGTMYEHIHAYNISNIGKDYVKIEQKTKEKIEIVGISIEVKNFEQGEDE